MIVKTIARAKIVAILRGREAGRAEHVAKTLIGSGIEVLEITLTTPDATETIERLRSWAPAHVQIGAGTVITAADASKAVNAGAQFLVTPTVTDSVAVGAEAGVPVLAGAFTATEAVTAMNLGASMVKLFPAGPAGPAYLKALRDPLPHIPFVAVGGIGLPEMVTFHAAGAVGFGIGGPLVQDAMRGGSIKELAERGKQFVRATSELSC